MKQYLKLMLGLLVASQLTQAAWTQRVKLDVVSDTATTPSSQLNQADDEDNPWNYGLDEKVTPLLERFNQNLENAKYKESGESGFELDLLDIIKEALETLDKEKIKHFIAAAKNNLNMKMSSIPETDYYIDPRRQILKRLIMLLDAVRTFDRGELVYALPFRTALRLRDGNAVIKYLEQHKAQVNTPVDTDEGYGAKPPMFYFGNQLDVVKKLEQLGADLHFGNDEFLGCAVSSCSLPVTKYLVNKDRYLENKKHFKVTQKLVDLAEKNNCSPELMNFLIGTLVVDAIPLPRIGFAK